MTELHEELRKAEKLIVRFKSVPANYDCEESGLKPNTIREEATLDEERKLRLRYFNKGRKNLFVVIENSETGEVFERKVTDVSYWKGWFIISWNPNASVLEKLRKELKGTCFCEVCPKNRFVGKAGAKCWREHPEAIEVRGQEIVAVLGGGRE